MKKILSTIIAFTVCMTISGQQISQSNNHYRGNDVVEKNQRDHGDNLIPLAIKGNLFRFYDIK